MKIAVSGCLLGEEIRFDRGHKRDTFLVDELGKYAEFISFCPENLAFGTPRPTIRMVKEDDRVKIVSNKDGKELGDPLLQASQRELEKIKAEEIRGIVFKSKSPTCGLKSSRVYLPNGF
ncbi:MAG TPA: DUF523 domain-containing protein, partial [Campylobacteraceae bacterium]|nr:DUF523 domain-containing protein [Campylobacteraceae bacterium]